MSNHLWSLSELWYWKCLHARLSCNWLFPIILLLASSFLLSDLYPITGSSTFSCFLHCSHFIVILLCHPFSLLYVLCVDTCPPILHWVSSIFVSIFFFKTEHTHTEVWTMLKLVRLLKQKKHNNTLYFGLASFCSSHSFDFWLDLSWIIRLYKYFVVGTISFIST